MAAGAHLDLEVEVGREGDLGLEHGPVLAHEVAIHSSHRVPRLLLFHGGLVGTQDQHWLSYTHVLLLRKPWHLPSCPRQYMLTVLQNVMSTMTGKSATRL